MERNFREVYLRSYLSSAHPLPHPRIHLPLQPEPLPLPVDDALLHLPHHHLDRPYLSLRPHPHPCPPPLPHLLPRLP